MSQSASFPFHPLSGGVPLCGGVGILGRHTRNPPRPCGPPLQGGDEEGESNL